MTSGLDNRKRHLASRRRSIVAAILPLSTLVYPVTMSQAQGISAPVASTTLNELPQPTKNKDLPPPPAVHNSFPILPPSRNCLPLDLAGKSWKMTHLYEQPPSLETKAFHAHPMQYMHFDKDSHYRAPRFAKNGAASRKEFYKSYMRQSGDALQQYVVGKTGYLYLYNDSSLSDTKRCLVVTKKQGRFELGEMLLMPAERQPKNNKNARYLRQYTNIPRGSAGASEVKTKSK